MKKSLIISGVAGILLLLKILWTLFEMHLWEENLSVLCTIRIICTNACFVCLVIAPIFLFNRIRWTYLMNALLDVWLVGNLIYLRSYGDLLSHWLMDNISAMEGVWGSVFVFMEQGDWLFPILSILWIVFCETILKKHAFYANPRMTLILVGAACLLFVPSAYTSHKTQHPISPFHKDYSDISMGRMWYMVTFGPIAHLANEVVNLMVLSENFVPPTREELSPYMCNPEPSNDSLNLLIVFFESCEYWVLQEQVGKQYVMPCVRELASQDESRVYSVISDVAAGKSSDAQLLAFTGLLPITNGAVSMRYMRNTFPSLVHYSKAASKKMFIPTSSASWNQAAMSIAYGFDEVWGQNVSDSVLTDTVIDAIQKAPRPFLIFQTTMASHAPFQEYAHLSSLPNKHYDADHYNYIRSVNYTDRQLGREIQTVLQDSILRATTRILIMGDHPIFPGVTTVPMIWYDPTIDTSATSIEEMHQVDVYRFLSQQTHISTPWLGLQHTDVELSNRIIGSNAFAKTESTEQ